MSTKTTTEKPPVTPVKEAPSEMSSQPHETDVLNETVIPLVNQGFVGGTLGFATGYALRTVGRAAAVGVGSAFVMLQGLSYTGYVKVDWRKLERDTLGGQPRTAEAAVNEIIESIAFNAPAGAAYTAGMLYAMNVAAFTSVGVGAVGGLGARLVLPRVAVGAGAAATVLPGMIVATKKYLLETDFGEEPPVPPDVHLD